MNEKILIVDDEHEIADLVELCLANEGFITHKFYDGESALNFIENKKVDLAVIDVMMPNIDGFSLVRLLRERFMFPVIMLTARVGEADMITGLTLGADDYITKPFSPPELVARVRTQLRRYTSYNSTKKSPEIDIRGLSINSETRKCTLDGKPINFSPLEFSIVLYLCERRGSVVKSEDLFEAVWGEKYLESSNTVTTHIARIREKLNEPPRRPKYIKTVWGVGYTVE